MQIYQMQINHFTNPIGFDFRDPTFTYKIKEASGKKLEAHKLEISIDPDFKQLIYTTEKESTTKSLFTNISLDLKPRTRYWWRVQAWSDTNEEAINVSWFETGKLDETWQSKWISPTNDKLRSAQLSYQFKCQKEVEKVRLYICGLGLYEATINEEKVSAEFLTPGYNNYDAWIQYQSYDITKMLETENEISVILGQGWYKGRFGFDGGSENIYGSRLALNAEIRIVYTDGSSDLIVTDDNWQASTGIIGENSIYYGEDQDETLANQSISLEEISGPTDKLHERLSAPVIVAEKMPVKSVINEPELLLDLGQNMVGWVTFKNRLPKGTTIKLEFAETLIHGKFYRDNLREARAAFVYTSNGDEKWVRPHFTFFGFRYVRITGWPENLTLNPDDFVGIVLTTEMQRTGWFETDNSAVNRLYQNILWSQKGNFLEVPTDCPQRDERMGWTGDAQIFSKTALYNADATAFYQKFGFDLETEQRTHGGAPTMTIPNVPSDLPAPETANGIWGDAAVVIPWNVYLASGDSRILRRQFKSMKAWLDYVATRPFENGLWVKDFQFGDWLALDGDDPTSPIGGTEAQFVANVYYLNSLRIASKTAQILGQSDPFKERAKNLKQAIRNEYFSPNGRFVQDTQTGYLLALHFDLVSASERFAMIEKLKARIQKDQYHLTTGFVGTPLLNPVLSDAGLDDLAYTLLLNDDYPSWLYEVKMGATTIWERWNSILPNGDMSPEGMNSLNHYAYGAVGSWLYEDVLGIKALDPGFSKIQVAPHVHWSIPRFSGSYLSPNGLIKVAFEVDKNNQVTINLTVPFNTEAHVRLPYHEENEKKMLLTAGDYEFKYQATTELRRSFDEKMTLKDILADPLTAVRFKERFEDHRISSEREVRHHANDSLADLKEQNLLTENELSEFLNNLREI
ncbi:alpha-L-rhamnosidase [Xylocopilactobacillus apicola]|uniref:alpha-L-rhamnosidase n=1 Tax=Xylocopilactobacillus apicola TaxID=2932184 RepID=A0AAU9DDP6_9LACO|nr:alpha-L-rhamnosidase [Xylocopilactobacillus apicola]BDR58952.1 alfa-L-rhamnosidase [Xylocopilactobacillus apicola]